MTTRKRRERPAPAERPELAVLVPFEPVDPVPAVDLSEGVAELAAALAARYPTDAATIERACRVIVTGGRGDAERVAEIEEDAAERASLRADEAAELAAELAADPVRALDQLGAVWSPSLDAYAAGKLDAGRIRCALCQRTPCGCPPFGTPEYLALVDQRHGRRA